MKRFLFIGIMLSCTTFLHAGPYDWEQTLDQDSATVTISTTLAKPTLILTKDSYVQRTWIVNASTFSIFISSVSNNLSFTTSFGIPGVGTSGNQPIQWTPDGTNAPFEGQLYAVANTQTPPSISIFRAK